MGALEPYAQDWEVLRSFLPEGREEKARESGALQRARNIEAGEMLLRVLPIQLAAGASLKKTQPRAGISGLCELSSVAVFKRLRNAEEWLGWMCAGMLQAWYEAGESLRRLSFAPGQLALADGGYANPADVAHVADQRADLIVRAPVKGFALREANGGDFALLARLRSLAGSGTGDWSAWLQHEQRFFPGRLCASRHGQSPRGCRAPAVILAHLHRPKS